MAKAVEEVNVSPMLNNSAKSNSSYNQKLHPASKAIHSASVNTTIATQPSSVLLAARWKRTDKAAATPMESAFTAKQMLNISGE